MPQLHPDATAVLASLSKEGIRALYHFTSVENLPEICRSQGLCSKKVLEQGKRILFLKWPVERVYRMSLVEAHHCKEACQARLQI